MTEGKNTGKILFVMTGADEWTLDDGSKHKTGFWAEEAAAPLEVFREAGFAVTVATPRGVRPPVDEASLAPDAVGSAERAEQIRTLLETAPELQNPIALSDADVAEYDAVFVPGGHGPMEDLAVDADAGALLIAADRARRPSASSATVRRSCSPRRVRTGSTHSPVAPSRASATPRNNKRVSPTRPPGCSRTA